MIKIIEPPQIPIDGFRASIEKASAIMASVNYCFSVRLESYTAPCKEFRDLSDHYNVINDASDVKAISLLQDYSVEHPYHALDLFGFTLLQKIVNFK